MYPSHKKSRNSHNELEYILEWWLSKFTCQNFIRKFHFYISAHPNISTVIIYYSELKLKLNFGPVLEYFDPWKPRDYRKIGIRSKFWPWLVSLMLATEPAMDNTLNCFNNYRSNLLSTQKLYTFDAKPNPDREIWNKIFHRILDRGWDRKCPRKFKGFVRGFSSFGRTKVTFIKFWQYNKHQNRRFI